VQAAFKLTGDALANNAQGAARLRRTRHHRRCPGAQAAFGRVRVKEEGIDPLAADLRREIKSLATLIAALKESATALRAEPVDVVRLDKALAAIQASKEPGVAEVVPELQGELDLAQRALGDEFGQKLRAALQALGVAIGGRPPKFEIGRFELDANFAKRACRAALRQGHRGAPRVDHGGRHGQGVSGRGQGDPGAQRGRRGVDGAAVRRLPDVRRKREISGSRVNIVDVYMELVILRQGRLCRRAEQAHLQRLQPRPVHLRFLRVHQPPAADAPGAGRQGARATKSQTDSPAKSMWIVEGDSPYDGRYFSDIEFVKA
jgi:hypothetical protein